MDRWAHRGAKRSSPGPTRSGRSSTPARRIRMPRGLQWRPHPPPAAMQALVWILRLFIVAILIWFALKNSQQVEVFGLPGQVWQAPLVFVLLVVFIAGVVIGLLAWIPTVVRQRRELGRLRRAAEQQAALAALSSTPERDASGSEIHGI